ncbi:MAG: NCS2 family permease [Mycoplasma sp.]
MLTQIKTYFKFDDTKAVFKKEIIGGISTFLAMCYILAVNPSMIADAAGADLIGGLFLATAISSFLGTFVMGLWARVPVALAPGMGLNAFFTYTVAGFAGSNLGFDAALSITIMSGLIYFIIAMTPARLYISKQIPHNFKVAIGAGIGLFIAFVGLQNSGIIANNDAVLTGLGDFTNPLVLIALSLLVLGLVLHFAKIPGALIITMLVGAVVLIITICAGGVDGVGKETLITNYDGFSTFGQVAKAGWMGFGDVNMWKSPMTYFALMSFLYTDFFDTTGTLLAIDRQAKMERISKDWLSKANQVDAVCTVFGAGIGATTVTSYMESTVGVGAGARTGLAAIVTSLCFAASIALWPIIQVFMPVEMFLGTKDIFSSTGVYIETIDVWGTFQPITSCALIIVGILMISQLKYFEWEIAADMPTLFITMIFTLLTYSIANGIAFGMMTYVLMNGSLGIIQKIKHQKKVVNDVAFETADDNNPNQAKTREFNYLKRLNPTCYVVAGVSLVFVILNSLSYLF